MAQLALMSLAEASEIPPVAHWLDQAQQERLVRISHPARQRQFCAARHLAISLLEGQGLEPALQTQASGRPQAVNWPAPDGLSWSHTASWAGVVLGEGRVGLDIESIQPRRNVLAIAGQYFSARECAALHARAGEAQLSLFYHMWVAKEALLKALGTGLVGGLSRFELLPDEGGWQLFSTDPECWHLAIWHLPGQALCAVASDTVQSWDVSHDFARLQLQIVAQAG
ncbi:4'-phosphopantetheinyl transferase superfamily protein [Chitinibacter sp. GC72]|uniref:4'-phosphopantetheinyl transferase superfamily protein n=1 Tax=Chitinibacter sp. GC72 TaxID=1526917 RepID=UPI0012F8D28A|nr:4'-phosphopantetheinyl transferase superfamily protein [Chitinibacter sp. GC72]